MALRIVTDSTCDLPEEVIQKHRITVNALAPIAKTRMTEDLPTFQGVDTMTPEHISPAALFLASDLCADKTGYVLAVAGARMYAFKVIETPVNHRSRQFGVSKYGAMNRAFRGLADCFAVRWMAKRRWAVTRFRRRFRCGIRARKYRWCSITMATSSWPSTGGLNSR